MTKPATEITADLGATVTNLEHLKLGGVTKRGHAEFISSLFMRLFKSRSSDEDELVLMSVSLLFNFVGGGGGARKKENIINESLFSLLVK